jgi:hypothetical protein
MRKNWFIALLIFAFVSHITIAQNPSLQGEGNGLTLGFRSSGIEFWSSENGLNFMSHFYSLREDVYGDPSNYNVSVIYAFEEERGKDNITIEYGSASTPAKTLYGSIQHGFYDVVRLDIGGGDMNILLDGEEVTMDVGYEGLIANSIFWINAEGFDEPIFILSESWEKGDNPEDPIMSRQHFSRYINRKPDGSLIENNNYEETDVAIIEAIRENAGHFSDFSVDANGALFLPFDGLTVTNAGEDFDIIIEWDAEYSIEEVDATGTFKWVERVAGTPFDFSIVTK